MRWGSEVVGSTRLLRSPRTPVTFASCLGFLSSSLVSSRTMLRRPGEWLVKHLGEGCSSTAFGPHAGAHRPVWGNPPIRGSGRGAPACGPARREPSATQVLKWTTRGTAPGRGILPRPGSLRGPSTAAFPQPRATPWGRVTIIVSGLSVTGPFRLSLARRDRPRIAWPHGAARSHSCDRQPGVFPIRPRWSVVV